MTQKDKELLLKDLCARLPYGIIVHIKSLEDWGPLKPDLPLHEIDMKSSKEGGIQITAGLAECWNIEDVKPYLRPMSSMTEEEEKELIKLGVCEYAFHNDVYDVGTYVDEAFTALSWLFEHHFDVNGLLEKDLAIEAPEGMYNF